ncbi:hypothetical protein [Amycolatopsis sp. MEPSY49]|uniref:hypothetical protein n=1 Tax=Amycolatopsis sp. MEPSY49 TaxID=3151600 RepID=UPI003EF98F18
MGAADRRVPAAEVVNHFERANIYHSVIGSGPAQRSGRRRGPRRRTGLLDERDVKRAVGTYVPPACHGEAAEALTTDHLVALVGARGLGKQTGAIALLHEKTPKPLLRLSPASTPDDLARHAYRKGRGYLVADQAEDGRYPDFDWHRVRDAVRGAGAFLVVTRREPIGADVEKLTAIAWARPPLEAVVRAHLDGTGAGELHAALPPDATMTEAAGAAARVAAGVSVGEAVRGLERSAADVVRGWFDAGPGRQDVLEVTAAAFGAELSAAELAARREALGRHVPDDGREAAGPVARLVTAEGVFADPRYAGLVLAELRARQPGAFWPAVSAWLTEILETSGADVSIAFGLAGLSKVDADAVGRTYLEPWSAGRLGWAGQTTAAFAVWAMALDGRSRSAALQAVRGWASGSTAQRQTAALALSGELGAQFPAEAVQELRELLTGSDESAPDALGALFATLTAEGDGGELVVDLLTELGDDDARTRSTVAVLTARSAKDDELAISTLLGTRPDLAAAAGKLAAPLLADARLRGEGLHAAIAAGRHLKPADSAEFERAAAGPGPVRARPRPPAADGSGAEFAESPGDSGAGGAGGHPGDGPGRPEPGYPVTDRTRLKPRSGLSLRRARRLPEPGPDEVLVFHTGTGCRTDPGGRGRRRLVRRAGEITVVDRAAGRLVPVVVAIASAGPVPFRLVAGFSCTVTDPALVAASRVTDAGRRIRAHLSDDHRLGELGRDRRPSELDGVRRDVVARVRAFLLLRPLAIPGVEAKLTSLDLFAPKHPTENEHD